MNVRHSATNVQWSVFDRWEGPVLYGKCPYVLPALPSWADKVMYVVAATEGNLDSVNMYDRAICSVGVIQWTELTDCNVSNMLGLVAERAPRALFELDEAMARSAVKFDRTPMGKWRFRRGSDWLDTPDKLRGMYLAGSGLRGFWSRDQKAHASAWCAALANVFTHPEAQQAQVAFTASRVDTFALKLARDYLFDGQGASHGGIYGVARAAFLSYAINLPSVAQNVVVRYAKEAELQRKVKWSEPWLHGLLRALAFDSRVSIWPARYDRIRPRLESIFGVNLPDFAEDLRADSADGLGSPAALQAALLRLGFDPGPVDGAWGAKSMSAVRAYQQARGLEVDGHVGPNTRARLRADLDKLPP